jgi:hypothetical protein
MPSLLNAQTVQQLKELCREQWKGHRPSLFKSLQESGDLEKAMTSRFPYSSLQGGGDCRTGTGQGEGNKSYAKGSINHLFAHLRLITKEKNF